MRQCARQCANAPAAASTLHFCRAIGKSVLHTRARARLGRPPCRHLRQRRAIASPPIEQWQCSTHVQHTSPSKPNKPQRSLTNAAKRWRAEMWRLAPLCMTLSSTRNEQDSATLSMSGSASGSGNAPAHQKTRLVGRRAALLEPCVAAQLRRLQRRPQKTYQAPIATHWGRSCHAWPRVPASSLSHEPARHRESEA